MVTGHPAENDVRGLMIVVNFASAAKQLSHCHLLIDPPIKMTSVDHGTMMGSCCNCKCNCWSRPTDPA